MRRCLSAKLRDACWEQGQLFSAYVHGSSSSGIGAPGWQRAERSEGEEGAEGAKGAEGAEGAEGAKGAGNGLAARHFVRDWTLGASRKEGEEGASCILLCTVLLML